ncbi:primosomal protein DnaI [Risungbinella massiliensis]|uniref:primosomal protein DnaI n=1 Tax=Risungbinella massiliensis TaxID=1329796 RepID=UPI0005CC4560|nr:primosomal protein DnaI [Risungbinella massiliensis]
MKEVTAQINKLFPNRRFPSVDERLNELMSHLSIRSFQKENPDIPQEVYRRSLHTLSQYVREQGNCAACQGLETCGNMVTGHESELVTSHNYLDVRMKKCNRLKSYENMQKRKELLKSHKIPKSVLGATFQDIEFDERANVIMEAMQYCSLFDDGIPKQGLYLYGSFGVGKSHIAGAIAHYITGVGLDVFMAYVPDLVNEVYASIQKKTTSQLLDAIKQVKVLILDDIGAETMSPWFRDDVLGAVLQHRMAEELTTIFTSNLTLEELEKHLSYTQKGGHEPIKAGRIMERIRHYVKPLYVTGPNRRPGVV